MSQSNLLWCQPSPCRSAHGVACVLVLADLLLYALLAPCSLSHAYMHMCCQGVNRWVSRAVHVLRRECAALYRRYITCGLSAHLECTFGVHVALALRTDICWR